MSTRINEADIRLQRAEAQYKRACTIITRAAKELEQAQADWGEAVHPSEETEAIITKQVKDWIDTQVIAELIVDHVKEQEETLTLQCCKDTWLRQLELLGEEMFTGG